MAHPCDGCRDGDCDLCPVQFNEHNGGQLPTRDNDPGPPMSANDKKIARSLADFFSKGGDPYDPCG